MRGTPNYPSHETILVYFSIEGHGVTWLGILHFRKPPYQEIRNHKFDRI